jgi:hypothetical protein
MRKPEEKGTADTRTRKKLFSPRSVQCSHVKNGRRCRAVFESEYYRREHERIFHAPLWPAKAAEIESVPWEQEARAALAESKKKGTVSWGKIKKKLGL